MLQHVPTASLAAKHTGHFGPTDTSGMQALVWNARHSLDADPQLARQLLDKALESFPRGGIPGAGTSATRRPVSSVARGGLANWQLRKVEDHVERELDGTIAVEALAEIARLSVGHFCRAFKASTGQTPHAFIIAKRLRRAQSLILASDDPLSRIAVSCGFTDQPHLTRLFRRELGTTPLAWRRSQREVE